MPVKGPTGTALARLGQAAGERSRRKRTCCDSLLLLRMHRHHHRLLLLLLLVVVASSGATSLSAEASRGFHGCAWQNAKAQEATRSAS